jgi:membrane fusion protein (multidrug efflux system)
MSDQVITRDVVRPARTARWRLSRPVAYAALGLVALTAAGKFGHDWWTVGRFIESTDDAYVGGNVTPIAPHVAGFVKEILVTDNQYVRAGQPLIRLDPADYIAALGHAQAVLQARQAAIAALQARRVLQQSIIAGAEADLTARQAQAAFTAQDAERYRSLAITAAGSRQDAQKALAGDKAARAAVLAS